MREKIFMVIKVTTRDKIPPMLTSRSIILKMCTIVCSRKLNSLTELSFNAIPRNGIRAAKLMASAIPEDNNAAITNALLLGYAYKK